MKKNTFVRSLQSNDNFTENGMPTHSTSSNFCLDFFFTAGALRAEKNEERILSIFTKAYNEDPLTALKILFWARDVRGGAGERRIFNIITKFLSDNNDINLIKNLQHVPEYGRWKDLSYLYLNTTNRKVQLEIISLWSLALFNRDALCAKWMPSPKKTKSKLQDSKGKFYTVEKDLGLSTVEYRKLIVALRNVIETKMCANEWDKIIYEHVPSLAMSRYTKSFYKHDTDRFKKYIEDVKVGDKKINVGAIYPYDIIKSLRDNLYNKSLNDVCIEQWKNLPDYYDDSKIQMIPVIDVSGSMQTVISGSTTAMDISMSLGIYVSERSKGPFKDSFIMFSRIPKLVTLKGDIRSKIIQLSEIGLAENTNLELVFDLILNKSIEYNVPKSDMPTHILIISDMEFDSCTGHISHNAFEMIKNKYKDSGYNIPNVIFWNVTSRNDNFPVKYDENNTALISGFSPQIVKNVLSVDLNPYNVMMDTINNNRYDRITI